MSDLYVYNFYKFRHKFCFMKDLSCSEGVMFIELYDIDSLNTYLLLISCVITCSEVKSDNIV